ncbi:MAG: S-layer homology domain-containing protein [bacterium]|nr:S-layer homology domain-containing protein [bacterium]
MARRHAIIGALFLALALAPAAEAFEDLGGHWARQEVEILQARGLVETAARFHPDQLISRAEMVKLLVVAIEGHQTARQLAPLPSSFSDLGPRHWANGYVESAYERGLVLGAGQGAFGPDRPVTRAEVTVLLVRAAGWEAEALDRDPVAARRALPFSDVAAIPGWAAGHVLAAWERGLVGGYPDGDFRPQGNTTRGEAAALVTRLLRRQGLLYDLTGELVAMEGASLTVACGTGERRVTAGPETVFYRQGLPAGAADLCLLDEVRVVLAPGGEVLYLEAFLHDAVVKLSAVSLSGRSLSFGAGGDQVTVKVAETAALIRNGSPARLSDFQPGDRLYIMFSLLAGEVRAAWGARIDFEGTVAGAAAGRLEIILDGGPRRAFALAPVATLVLDGRPVGIDELQPGDRVGLTLNPQGALLFVDAVRPEPSP